MAPENTVAAFARGFDDGADGLELDVRLALDGVPVVVHDAALDRTGLSDGVIAGLTSKQLGEVNVGSWFNRAHPELAKDEYTRECVPTLERVFRLVIDRQTIARFTIYVELKIDDKNSRDGLVESVADLIRRFQFQNRVVVVSFDLGAIAQIKEIDPSIRTGALFAPRQGVRAGLRVQRIISAAIDHGVNELLLHKLIARPKLISAANSQNLRVVVWTADDSGWIEWARRMELHGLITNNPALFR